MITVDDGISFRQFTRIIQSNVTIGIRKANLRIHILRGDGWHHYYSWRVQSKGEKEVYKASLSEMGLLDGTWLRAEYVLSTFNMATLALGAVVAIPVAAAAAVTAGAAAAGVGASYAIGYLAGNMLADFSQQRAVHWVRVQYKGDDELAAFQHKIRDITKFTLG